ncbi:MAG: TonB-dependent siderophore receptor [Cellvibrionaceae bacterium]|nr:TonB-dependent siderophore receptor [Cellvibrionaceae bacterium]
MAGNSFTALNCLVLMTTTQISVAVQAQEDIEEVVVTAKQIPYVRLSDTATKSALDILDTPFTVSTYNSVFLEDLRSETLADAYPYTLGLSQTGTSANSFTLRGLPSDLQNVQVDGLPGLASRFGSPTTANIERVEVLKGPASVLYGLMEPGGLINVVSKTPQEKQSTNISVTAQSYEGNTSSFGDDLSGTVTLDTTGPLSEDGRWLYRVIASKENINSFRNGVEYKNLYFFPSVSYQASDELLFTFGLEYADEEGDADNGLVAVNNDINQTAEIDVRYQEDGDFDRDEGLVSFVRMDYDLSESARLRVNFRSVFHEDERKLFENNRVNDADEISESTLRRRDRHQLNKREYHFLDVNLVNEFDTGDINHKLLVGVNGGFERSDFERIRFGANVTPNISIFDPVLGEGQPSSIKSGTDRITDYWNYAFYIQDVMEINDQFSLMLGGRYDKQDADFKEQVSGFTDDQSSDALLPQAGVVFKPSENISFYASYTESFSPNSVERRAADGGSFDPEMGEQFEFGVKAALLDERVNITAAAFNINKSNILERNEDRDWELLGELESEGYEVEIQALPTENWQLRMGYAYVDSVISKSPNASLIGARNAFAPEHDAFLWTRYNFPELSRGAVVGVSLGLNYESERYTNASPSTQVELPSYVRTDLGFYYELNDQRYAINIENLFDEEYHTGGSRDTRIYPGDPRLISFSFNYSF